MPPDQIGYDGLYVQLEWENKKDGGGQKSVVGWDNFREMITCKTVKKRGV
jgi:hypothetical protein